MKKILSIALAAAMVFSMCAVSMAAQKPRSTRKSATSVETDYRNKSNQLIPGVYDAVGPFAYDVNDDKKLTEDPVEYGETAYYVLTDKDGTGITNSDSVDGLKIKAKWEEGDKLVKGVAIAKKKVTNTMGTVIPAANRYYYMLAVTVADSNSTSDADVIGTLTLNKTKSPKVKELKLAMDLNVNWAHSYLDSSGDYIVSDDLSDIKAEKYYSLKFDSDDTVELEFEDGSTFTVDVSGQGKTLVYFDTNFNSQLAAKYPLAELNFWNGNGAKFNRTGEFFLSVSNYDSTVFLYELKSDGALSEVTSAEFDDKDEGFYFRTRTLGKYVVSDMELETGTADSGEVDVVTPVVPVVPVNPGTGATA